MQSCIRNFTFQLQCHSFPIFHRGKNWGLERLSSLSKITQWDENHTQHIGCRIHSKYPPYLPERIKRIGTIRISSFHFPSFDKTMHTCTHIHNRRYTMGDPTLCNCGRLRTDRSLLLQPQNPFFWSAPTLGFFSLIHTQSKCINKEGPNVVSRDPCP